MDEDALQALLREAVGETVAEMLQTLLHLDREAFLREDGGTKNGHYPRTLETRFSRVSLQVPRDREGRYYPAFLKPRVPAWWTWERWRWPCMRRGSPSVRRRRSWASCWVIVTPTRPRAPSPTKS